MKHVSITIATVPWSILMSQKEKLAFVTPTTSVLYGNIWLSPFLHIQDHHQYYENQANQICGAESCVTN